MQISAADINRYRDTLRGIASSAASYVRSVIEDSDGTGATAMRHVAVAALTDSVGIHGNAAQALASQLFDEVCAAEGIDASPATLFDDIIDFGRIESRVRYLAKSIAEGEHSDVYVDGCSALADLCARRCNWENMVRNCAGNNVRYARVPTGFETCNWCIMLASRGFVYWTREDAQHANHMHCDCIVVCGAKGTTVEGYDPDAYYDQWRASGFMPPKYNNPTRIVPLWDGDNSSYTISSSKGGKSRRRRKTAERGLPSDAKEGFYQRINAVMDDPEKLASVYKEIVGELLADSRVLDADFEDVANHYAWALSEYHKLRIAA